METTFVEVSHIFFWFVMFSYDNLFFIKCFDMLMGCVILLSKCLTLSDNEIIAFYMCSVESKISLHVVHIHSFFSWPVLLGVPFRLSVWACDTYVMHHFSGSQFSHNLPTRWSITKNQHCGWVATKYRQRTIVVTEWGHWQRQAAFL